MCKNFPFEVWCYKKFKNSSDMIIIGLWVISWEIAVFHYTMTEEAFNSTSYLLSENIVPFKMKYWVQ